MRARARRCSSARRNSITPNLRTRGFHSVLEPLSRRELEVLRLLDRELTGPEIARHLYSPSTPCVPHQAHLHQLGVRTRAAPCTGLESASCCSPGLL